MREIRALPLNLTKGRVKGGLVCVVRAAWVEVDLEEWKAETLGGLQAYAFRGSGRTAPG